MNDTPMLSDEGPCIGSGRQWHRLYETIVAAGRADVEGVFVACTSMHVTPVIPECEAALGKPVLSSNQALAWHALRLAGVRDAVPG